MNEQVLAEIVKELKKLRTNSQQDISLASDFTPNEPFQLYVGVEGVVKGTDQNGVSINRHFITGYHPIVMITVLSTANGTTATNLAACFI